MSASKLLKVLSLQLTDSIQTSRKMTVSAAERHGAGIKGMDQLSTVTTRTQLQRIHIRSQSLRVVLSPPQTQRERKKIQRESKHV